MLRALAPLMFVVVGASVSACGDSATTPTPPPAPIPQDQYPATWVSTICDHVQGCCKTAGYAYDRAGCAAYVMQGFAGLSGNPDAIYDADAAGACIRAISGGAARCELMTSREAACQDVYRGTKPPGAACGIDLECAAPTGGSAWCNIWSWQWTDAGCRVHTRKRAGESCQETCSQVGPFPVCVFVKGPSDAPFTLADCYTDDGLYCSDSSVCTPLGKLGDTCHDGTCVPDAYCVPPQNNQPSRCTARIGIGHACDAPDSCVASAYCKDVATCARKLANGSPCTSTGNECRSGWCGGAGVCVDPFAIASAALCGAP